MTPTRISPGASMTAIFGRCCWSLAGRLGGMWRATVSLGIVAGSFWWFCFSSAFHLEYLCTCPLPIVRIFPPTAVTSCCPAPSNDLSRCKRLRIPSFCATRRLLQPLGIPFLRPRLFFPRLPSYTYIYTWYALCTLFLQFFDVVFLVSQIRGAIAGHSSPRSSFYGACLHFYRRNDLAFSFPVDSRRNVLRPN